MFGPALIIFRETLEAALVITIIAAATRTVSRGSLWIVLGILVGIVGAGVLAGLTERLADLADGAGTELFNAGVIGIAVMMLAWHHIWMASHGVELARDAKKVGTDVSEGTRGLTAIAALVALTVLREGAESVLFLHGMASGGGAGMAEVIFGGLLGVAGGAAVGVVMYFGLMRIPLKSFFNVTGSLLVLLAAGLASRMAGFLIQADWLPPLATPLWDTSAILSTDSILGYMLHVMVGYEPNPSGMQMVFYAITLVGIIYFSALVKQNKSAQQQEILQTAQVQ
jgi:high-affinity iron transporter